MLNIQHLHRLVGRVILVLRGKRAVVLRVAVVDCASHGKPAVGRRGIVDVGIGLVGAVERDQGRLARVERDAELILPALADGRLRAVAVVDDVHAVDVRAAHIQIVVFDIGSRVLFNVEIRRRGRVRRIRRARHDFQRARRVVRGIDAVAGNAVPPLRVDRGRGQVVQLARAADRAARGGLRRADEVDAAVRIRLQRVGVPVGKPVFRLFRDVVVELRDSIVPADAVEHEFAEVVIGRLAVVIVEIILIPRIFVGRLRHVGAHAVDLVIGSELIGRVGVCAFGNGHRVVDIGIALIRTADHVGAHVLGERRVGLRRGIVGGERAVRHIDDIDGVVHRYEAIYGRVVRHAEMFLNIRPVQLGAAEGKHGVIDGTRRVADGVGRRVVDAVAVNIQTGRIVRRDHQRRDDRFRRVLSRLDVRRLDAHERALDGRAVSVVGRVRLDAVDEVDVFPFLHDESALRTHLARHLACEGGELIVASGKERRRSSHDGGCRHDGNMFEQFTHRNVPYDRKFLVLTIRFSLYTKTRFFAIKNP